MVDQPTDAGETRCRNEPVGLDSLFAALADAHRRAVLRYFHATGTDGTTVDDLVEYTVSRAAVPEDRERLSILFHHATLPHLEYAGFIEYDVRSGTIRFRPSPLLERVLGAIVEVEVAG